MRSRLLTIGWREWVSLPGLKVPYVKVKVDTGARTSALHAFDITTYRRRGERRVRFTVHPWQRNNVESIECSATVIDARVIRSSAGHEQERLVIETDLELFGSTWPIELTLTSRDTMGFRMLLGRQAVRRRCVVDPGRSYLAGKPEIVRKNGSRGRKRR